MIVGLEAHFSHVRTLVAQLRSGNLWRSPPDWRTRLNSVIVPELKKKALLTALP